MIHYKKFSFTELQGKLPCSEKPSKNSCHQSNTSNPNLPSHFIHTDFCIIFNPVCSRTVSAMTGIYTGRYGVQNMAGATELSLFQNIQTSSSTNPAFNSSFFTGRKVACADSLTTHIHLVPSLKISGAIPPLNLSASLAYTGYFTTLGHNCRR